MRNFSIPHLCVVEEGVPGELGILENSKALTLPPPHTPSLPLPTTYSLVTTCDEQIETLFCVYVCFW